MAVKFDKILKKLREKDQIPFYTVGSANADYITDGVADDVQIQQAIDAASAAGGGIVHIKEGQYTQTSAILPASKVIIEGEGVGTIIKKANSINDHQFTYNNISHAALRDLQIDGNKANNAGLAGKCINLVTAGSSNITFDNLYIHDGIKHGIFADSAVAHNNINIKNCRIEDMGTSADGSGIYLGGVLRYKIENVWAAGCTLDGVQFDGGNGEIVNLHSYSNSRCGLYFSATAYSLVTNSEIYSNTSMGVHVDTSSVVLTSNSKIYSNGNDGFRFTSVNGSRVQGCEIFNNGAVNASAGIRLVATSGGDTSNRHIIVGNSIYDNQGGSATQEYGILATGSGTVDFNNVSSNDIYSNASANFQKDTWGANNVEGLNSLNTISLPGVSAQDITVKRSLTGAGQNLTIQAGGAVSGGTNTGGGALILSTGITTGNARSSIQFNIAQQAGSGSGDNTPSAAAVMFRITSANPILSLGNISNSATGLTTTSNAFALTGNAAGALQQYRHTTANTAGNSLIIEAGGATSGATDKAGGSLILRPGLSTGTGSSAVRIQTNTSASSTGTTDNTVTDRIIVTSPKILTDNSATNLVSCTIANNSAIGGVIRYTIEVTDGTDYQAETGYVTFAAVNKAGTVTTTITEHNSSQAVSAGTLSTTWAMSAANPSVISVNADTSLTPSTGYPRITYTVENYGQQAIAIQ